VILGEYGLLLGIGTAHTGTIAVVSRCHPSGTNALDPCDLLRVLPVGCSQHFTLVRARGAEQPLIIHARQNVGKIPVMILFLNAGVKGFKSRGQNDGSNLYVSFLWDLIQVYCLVLAYGLANAAFLLFEVQATLVDVCHERYGLGEIDVNSLVIR
jgi:hypothetical protein